MDNQLVWSTLSTTDFLKTNSTEHDLTDVIDELIVSIPQAKVIAIIYENETPVDANNLTPARTSSLLLYTIKNIDAMALIKEFNPNGTKGLAKATIQAPIAEAEKTIITAIENKLNKLPL
jgi:hypothetical protein